MTSPAAPPLAPDVAPRRAGRAARVAAWAERRLGGLLGEDPRFDLAAGITLVMLLMTAENVWYLRLALYSLVGLGVVYRPVVRWPAFWFVIVAVYVFGNRALWYKVDNHEYLFAYWTLALGLALSAPEPMRALATAARLVVGLCFLFATGWKALTPEFVDGTFFHYALLLDGRFSDLAVVIGGLSRERVAENYATFFDVLYFRDPTALHAIATTPTTALVARGMAWWTLFIEGLVALCFLWPRDGGPRRWRDAALVAFMCTTYLLAPVKGFGWVLTAMGVVQCDARRWRYWPLVYVAVFLLVTARSQVLLSQLVGYATAALP